MTLLYRFQQHWKQNFNCIPANSKFLLAVSGGIDSVVMANLFYNAGFDFNVAHCNFKLRKEESNRDETFVNALSKKYNKTIFISRFETESYAAEKKYPSRKQQENYDINGLRNYNKQKVKLPGIRFFYLQRIMPMIILKHR